MHYHHTTSKKQTADAVSMLSKKLRAGSVYRREELASASKAVDRHLIQLQQKKRVQKLAQGLYYVPRTSAYGVLPPRDETLVAAFLRDKNFLIFSPSGYNTLSLGSNQLYNRTVVYNHKRHGIFTFGKRSFDFRMKPCFPKKLSPEFLFVDLLNNINELAEENDEMLLHARQRAKDFDSRKLHHALSKYANMSTKKTVRGWLNA